MHTLNRTDVDNLAREFGLERFAWVGTSYQGFQTGWVDTEPEEAGGSAYISDLRLIPNRDEVGELPSHTSADFIGVPVTLWGDYCGSDLGRSNSRSLVRDYPDLFVTVHDEYPLYDEDDHSALELELADEAWDAWVRFDLGRSLSDAGVDVDAISDDELRERFYAFVSDTPQPYYCESADSVVFPYWDDVVAALACHYGAHNFGELERSRFAGTVHRKCTRCDVVEI
jgi:hypothetical protein